MNDPRLRRWLYVPIALVAVVVAWLAIRQTLGTPVETATVTSMPLKQTVVVSGRVLAPAKVGIGATITARVARVGVDEGDRVGHEQVLIELERAELAAALAQAQASEASAVTRILQWRDVGAPSAQEQHKQAEANYRVAQRHAGRQEELFGKGFIGEAALDESLRALAVARSQLETARATAAANTTAGAERRQLDDQLAQARAARETAAAKLAQTRILAPARGVVLDRSVEPGDIVQPGKTLMTLALDGPARLTALIDEKNLAVLAVGQHALVSADAFPSGRFDAVLEYLAPGIDVQRGTIEAKFNVPVPPAFLRADMTVSIDIGVADKRDAKVVPAAALRDTASLEPWVLVVRDGRAQRQPVTLGARNAAQVEVVVGLITGDRVVVTAGVEPGTRVAAR